MKRALAVLAAVGVTVTGAVAYGASHANLPTKQPGVLTIALDPPAPLFQVGTTRGTTVVNPKGMEVDLARDIATRLGYTGSKVKWYYVPQTAFDTIFAPTSKPYDFALAEVTITPARAKNVNFSVPYFKSNQGVLLRKGLSPAPKSIADLKSLTLCAQATTTGAAYIKTHIRPAHALYPASTVVMFNLVENGRCDAAIFDTPILAGQKKQKPSAYGPLAGEIITHENYGIVFEKGSKLLTPVNKALTTLINNGTVGKLQKKWFNINFSKLPIFH
jgi:polar amino acid transport system substrate-binding protein